MLLIPTKYEISITIYMDMKMSEISITIYMDMKMSAIKILQVRIPKNVMTIY